MVVILLAVVVSACKKTKNVGLDIVANPDNALNVRFNDSCRLTTYSTVVDSLVSKKTTLSLLGSMVDPIFGTTTAGFYTQLRLANNNLDFGDNPVCDSIVLSLGYSSFYGDSVAIQHILVYEIDESLEDDSVYYSNSTVRIKPTPIFDDNITFNLKDSVLLNDNMVLPHLRLTLDKSFGENIIDKSGSTELSNNEEFLKFLKGLHVTADQIMLGGGHASFSLLSKVSALTLYYHNDDDTTNEMFLINKNCNRFQNYNHYGYSNANIELQNQLNKTDTTSGQQEFYLQGIAGSRGFIRIEDLETLISGDPVAVQLAEMELNISNYNSNYKPPYNIVLIGINSEGKDVFLKESNAGKTSIGGLYNETKKQYVFNITRTVQDMILGKGNIIAFRLLINAEVVMPNRLVFGGSDAPDGARLKIYYTKVK